MNGPKCVFLAQGPIRKNGGTAGICKALTHIQANCGPECHFFMTAHQAKAKEDKAYARLRSLPESDQSAYAGTYHGGVQKWKR